MLESQAMIYLKDRGNPGACYLLTDGPLYKLLLCALFSKDSIFFFFFFL